MKSLGGLTPLPLRSRKGDFTSLSDSGVSEGRLSDDSKPGAQRAALDLLPQDMLREDLTRPTDNRERHPPAPPVV